MKIAQAISQDILNERQKNTQKSSSEHISSPLSHISDDPAAEDLLTNILDISFQIKKS